MSIGPETKRVAEIILKWVEEGKDVPDYFKKRIDGIKASAAQAYKQIELLNRSFGDEQALMKQLYNIMDKDLIRAFREVGGGMEMMVRTAEAKDTADAKRVKAEEKRARDEERMGQRRVERMSRLSRTFGWLGYRLTMMGRIVTRWVMAPIQMTVKGLTNLDQSMMTVASTMGLAAMFGQDFSASLLPLLNDLPRLALETQAASGAIKSQFLVMAAELAPDLNALQFMLAGFLEDFGPGFATGFAEGLAEMNPRLEAFLNILGPHADTIGKFAAELIPLAIGLTALGVALFFLSPALRVLASIGGIGLGSTTIAGAGLAGLGYQVTGTIQQKGKAFWEGVDPALGFLYDALSNLMPGGGRQDWFKGFGGGGTPDAIIGATAAAKGGDINIYGDIHVPEGVDVDWLFGLFEEYQRRQKEGYEPGG